MNQIYIPLSPFLRIPLRSGLVQHCKFRKEKIVLKKNERLLELKKKEYLCEPFLKVY